MLAIGPSLSETVRFKSIAETPGYKVLQKKYGLVFHSLKKADLTFAGLCRQKGMNETDTRRLLHVLVGELRFHSNQQFAARSAELLQCEFQELFPVEVYDTALWSYSTSKSMQREEKRNIRRLGKKKFVQDMPAASHALEAACYEHTQNDVHDVREQFTQSLLSALDEDDQRLAREYFWQGKSRLKIAEETGISRKVIGLQLKAIMKKLRNCLTVCDDELIELDMHAKNQHTRIFR